jgi:hypothetical protein
MADRMRRCERLLGRAMRATLNSLAYFGGSMSGFGGVMVPHSPFNPPEYTADPADYRAHDGVWRAEWETAAPRELNPVPDREPPPGHPERLVTDLPPSPTEQRLWSQFE